MRTREKVIELFMFEPRGANKDVYLLSYEWRKQSYREDKSILDELIKEGLVTIVEKDLKTILFRYHAPKQGGKRKGAGRTPKFKEATTTFSCRVPVSKKQELSDYVNAKLAEWSQGSE